MNLWDLELKQSGVIKEINPKGSLASKLKIYGFSTGQKAECLFKTSFNGPRVFLLEDTIYSLSYELASQILIQTLNDKLAP